MEPRSARRPASSLLFPLAGWLLLAAGLAVSIGPKYVPELSWYAKLVIREGFHGEILCLAGVILIGMGWLAGYQRSFTRTLLQPGMAEAMIEDLRTDITATQDLIRNLGGTQVEQGVDLRYLKKALGEARNEARAADPKDSIFRLAASLDQLGARLDQRIGEATGVLQDANYELSSLLESACDGLQDKMDRSSRKLAQAVMESLSNVTAPLGDDGYDGELEMPAHEGLRVLVDLEDDEPQEPTQQERDLGLLNDLGDIERPETGGNLFQDPTGRPPR